MNERKPRIAVIGLGYVGLPVAVALARHFEVTGFDIDRGRVSELKEGRDRTNEISADELAESALGAERQRRTIAGPPTSTS